jgi:hypothetical protein
LIFPLDDRLRYTKSSIACLIEDINQDKYDLADTPFLVV